MDKYQRNRIGENWSGLHEVWTRLALVAILIAIATLAACTAPTPYQPREPVIIVPGIGACLGSQSGIDWWPGWILVGPYRAIRQALEGAGYSEDVDLFVACYDWRGPLDQAAERHLVPIIDQALERSGHDKVNIVAHSLGGLLSRAYVQSDIYRDDVNRLVIAGSPSYGATQPYYIWEGGVNITDYPEHALIEFLIQVRMWMENRSRIEIIRSIRSLQELLPTFLYLFDATSGDDIPLDDLTPLGRNQFLTRLNQPEEIEKLLGRARVTTIAGREVPALFKIGVDQITVNGDLWPDGVPRNLSGPLTSYPNKTDVGDRTVLLSSVRIPGADNRVIDVNHSDVIQSEEALRLIFELLGEDFPEDLELDTRPESILFIFSVGDVNLGARDPFQELLGVEAAVSEAGADEYYGEGTSAQLIVVEEPPAGGYTVGISGRGVVGTYRLGVIQTGPGQAQFALEEGLIEEGEVRVFGLVIEKVPFPIDLVPSFQVEFDGIFRELQFLLEVGLIDMETSQFLETALLGARQAYEEEDFVTTQRIIDQTILEVQQLEDRLPITLVESLLGELELLSLFIESTR